MRKKLLALFIIIAVIIIYLFTPGKSEIITSRAIKANQNTVFRTLTNPGLLSKWSGSKTAGSLVIEENNGQFFVKANAFNIVNIKIPQQKDTIESFISLLPLKHDSTQVIWKADLPQTGAFYKLQHFFQSRALRSDMNAILLRLEAFAQNEENVYGLKIIPETVKDTLLVVAKMQDTIPPSAADYYHLIAKLRNAIAQNGAQETNYPMLNITQTNAHLYETMVAIPVNKMIPAADGVVPKRMIPGNILMAEVRGPYSAVAKGLQQLDLYANEHQLTAPAIPFQLLVSDRLAEKDSTQWITRLYYPFL